MHMGSAILNSRSVYARLAWPTYLTVRQARKLILDSMSPCTVYDKLSIKENLGDFVTCNYFECMPLSPPIGIIQIIYEIVRHTRITLTLLAKEQEVVLNSST